MRMQLSRLGVDLEQRTDLKRGPTFTLYRAILITMIQNQNKVQNQVQDQNQNQVQDQNQNQVQVLTSISEVIKHGVFLKYFFSWFLYYTYWNLLLVVFGKWTHKYLDLHLSCLIVACASWYIFHIYPNSFVNRFDDNYAMSFDPKINGISYYIWDFLLHWMPLIVVCFIYPIERFGNKTILTFFAIVFFMVAVNARVLYKTHIEVIMVFIVVALMIRLAL